MKIKTEHFEKIRAAIKPFDTAEVRGAYARAGLSDKRYRWDLLRQANLIPWVCDTLYQYMNDDHIDTALRRIVPTLLDTGV